MTEIGVEAEFALEEPTLKYNRFENDCPVNYAHTEITTVAAHSKLVVIGCTNGTICIFDHLGNLIQNGKYKKHFSSINQLGISDDGNFVISCGDDGFVFIYTLTDPDRSELVNIRHSVKSVAISPEYSRNKKFVTGDKKITLYSQGPFGRRTAENLYVPPGSVRTVKWRKNIIIWSDDEAVRVYDLRRRCLINYIQKPASTTDPLDTPLSCYIAWYSDACFIIGWESTVQVCYISQLPTTGPTMEAHWTSTFNDRQSVSSLSLASHGSSPTTSSIANASLASLPQRRAVRIGCRVDLPLGTGVICGVAAHQDRILVLLYPSRSMDSLFVLEGLDSPRLPQILILDVGDALQFTSAPSLIGDDVSSILSGGDETFSEVSREDVTLKLSSSVGCFGMGIVSVPGEDSHFIYSRVDIICAQASSADDRIDWYLKQDLPQRALQIANEHQAELYRYSPKKLGMLYLDKLIEEDNFVGAAALCKIILTDSRSWEDQVYRFLHLGQLHVLVPYLPTSKNLISTSTYEVVLIDLLSKSPQKFAQKLQDWSPISGLYSLDPIIAAVQERTSSCSHRDMYAVACKDPDMLALWRALIILYEHTDHPEKGLELSINLKDHGVFDLLRRQLPGGGSGGRFVCVVRKQIIALCEIDTTKAVQLMIDCTQELSVDSVVQELNPQPMLLYRYLNALHLRNPQAALSHAHRLVKLYAVYSREQLLPFLRSTDQYPLNEALTLCNSLNFIPETVYLLTRVGRRKDALRLLMEKGEDDLMLKSRNLTLEQRKAEVAAQAIAYCEEASPQNQIYYTFADHLQRRPMRRPRQPYRMIAGGTDKEHEDGAEEEEEDEGEEDLSVSANGSGQSSEREAAELWHQVVLFAVDKPTFICALLKHASTERIDPSLLVRRIAPGMEIPMLKESLVNLLHNTQMQIALRRGCQKILLRDSQEIFSRVVSAQGRGIRVDLHNQASPSCAVCRICRQGLLIGLEVGRHSNHHGNNNNKGPTGTQLQQPALLVFRCSHAYHQECLSKLGRYVACPVCVQERAAA